MKVHLSLPLWFFLLAAPAAYTSEIDSFTSRPTAPEDWSDRSTLDAINEHTNQLLAGALSGLKGCDLKKLHFAVKNALGGGEIGRLENWAIQNPALKKVVVPYAESIYADAGIRTGSSGLFLMGIAPTFVLGGHYVGADKLGHFFDQGYDYYESIFLHHADPTQTVESMGLDDEDSVNGMAGNGVRSYGDMASNFGGYLFWRQVAASSNPYFKCQGGNYVRTPRKFDWSDYVSDAWDEGINCSEFSPGVAKSVTKALKKLGLSCPVNPASCQSIVAQTCGFTFLSPACLAHVQMPTYPDSACLKLLELDKAEAQVCTYPTDMTRRPTIKTILDLLDGGKSLVQLRSRQVKDWAIQSENQAYLRAVRILRRLQPTSH